MQRATLKALYQVHSWVGLFLGLALYVMLFSGSVSLFVNELRPWEVGAVADTTDFHGLALDQAVASAALGAPPGTGFSVSPASPLRPWIVIELSQDDSGAAVPLYFDAAGGERVDVPTEHVTLILERLHTDLLLPSPWGRYLTGLLGVAMLVSLFTGVMMHRKILREMWSVRLWRSRRLRWADLHKAAAIWGLPFHLMIAFTGALLGLMGLILMLNAFIAYGGDVDAATAALSGEEIIAAGEAAPMRATSELLRTAVTALPGLQPEYLSFAQYGDRAATLQVWGTLPQTLVYFPQVTLNAASGEVLAISNWRKEHWVRALYGAMTPLHYASYGGLVLKTLYAVLGLTSCFLVISGLRIWQLRVHPRSSDLRLPLVVGVCYGLPLAMAVLLFTSRLLTDTALATYEGRLYLFLFAWLLAIACAWRFRWTGRLFCIATGITLSCIPLASAAGDRVSLVALLRVQPDAAPILAEVVLTLLGAVMLLLALAVRHTSSAQAAPGANHK